MSIITLNTRSLPDSAVTTAKIAADAVTDAKVADDIIGTEHLTAGEVDATALGANAVTAAKLNNDIVSGLTALGAEPADTDEFLVSDAGTIKRLDYSYIKGGGKVLQVVQGTKTDSTLSTSSSFVSTGLSVDITPSASSSKVLVIVSAYIDSNANTVQKFATIFRDSTDLGSGTGGLTAAYNGAGRLRSAMNMSVLDSPSSTSQITYEMYMRNASSANIQVNSESGKVTIIAMEIGA